MPPMAERRACALEPIARGSLAMRPGPIGTLSRGTLVMKVRDATTGQSLGGSGIFLLAGKDTLRRAEPLEFWRDTVGVIAFAAVPAGSYTLSIGRPGYLRERFRLRLRAGAVDTAVVDLMPLAAALEGRPTC